VKRKDELFLNVPFKLISLLFNVPMKNSAVKTQHNASNSKLSQA